MDSTTVISGAITALTLLFGYLKTRDEFRFKSLGASLEEAKKQAAAHHDQQVALETQVDTLKGQLEKSEDKLKATVNAALKVAMAERLARSRAQSEEVLAEMQVAVPVSPAQVHIGAKVLLAEDDLTTGHGIASMLKRIGYAVEWTKTAEDAWKQVKAFAPDVAILDYILGEENGLDLARRIKNNPDNHVVPILLFTAAATEEWEEVARQAKEMDITVLRKPVALTQLLAAIAELLGHKDVGGGS